MTHQYSSGQVGFGLPCAPQWLFHLSSSLAICVSRSYMNVVIFGSMCIQILYECCHLWQYVYPDPIWMHGTRSTIVCFDTFFWDVVNTFQQICNKGRYSWARYCAAIPLPIGNNPTYMKITSLWCIYIYLLSEVAPHHQMGLWDFALTSGKAACYYLQLTYNQAAGSLPN